VEREIRDHGSARVIVTLRADAMPALGADDFSVATRWHRIHGFAGVMRAGSIEKLSDDPNVAAVSLDLPGAGDLAQSVPLIGGNIVHAMGYTGNGVTVAVLDSGIDNTHPDFAGRIVDQQCFCANVNGAGCCPN